MLCFEFYRMLCAFNFSSLRRLMRTRSEVTRAVKMRGLTRMEVICSAVHVIGVISMALTDRKNNIENKTKEQYITSTDQRS